MKETELRPREYQPKHHTPELITKFYQTIWRARGESVDMVFEVCPCPFTQKELTALEQQRKRRVGYLPAELATQQNRHILGRMFPQMRSNSVQKNNLVTNDKNPYGWFDYEIEVDAPYLNTNEKQLIERLTEDGRKLLSLNQYIVAGQDSKLLTGRYLDEERTWTRLGSRNKGLIVSAGFYQGGSLEVIWFLESGGRGQRLGGRSSGAKKT